MLIPISDHSIDKFYCLSEISMNSGGTGESPFLEVRVSVSKLNGANNVSYVKLIMLMHYIKPRLN